MRDIDNAAPAIASARHHDRTLWGSVLRWRPHATHMRKQHGALIGAILLSAASVAAPLHAGAQPAQIHDDKTMSFDLWCQERAHIAPERCDKRTASDESAFETYRASLERHDTPSAAIQDQAIINRNIMTEDPVDNPQKQDLGAQQP